MIWMYIAFAVVAMALSLLLVPVVSKWAVKIGAVDQPDARKVHTKVMPRMGGLAIYMSFFIVVLITQQWTMQLLGLFLGSSILIAVGILDDIKDIPARLKLLGQIVAAVVVVALGVRVEFMTNIIGGEIWHLSSFSIPFTIIWIVAITNAVNLIDGLDGLAAGTSIIAAITMAVVGYIHDQYLMTALALVLAGSTLGFLRYNFNPAKIFMGDTGSMFLGFNLAVLAVMGVTKSVTFLSLVTPILILGIPIFDTVFAILRRTIQRKPIFKPDKEHLHHCLLNRGLTHRNTVLVIYMINIFLAASGVIITYVTPTQGAVLLVVISTVVLAGARKIGIIGVDPTHSILSKRSEKK